MERKQTQQLKKDFLTAFQESLGNVSHACDAIGVARSTYYDWLKSDPDFKKLDDEARQRTVDTVESVLYDLIVNEKNPTATIFFLKANPLMGSRRYREGVDVTTNGESISPLSGLNPERQAEILRILNAESDK